MPIVNILENKNSKGVGKTGGKLNNNNQKLLISNQNAKKISNPNPNLSINIFNTNVVSNNQSESIFNTPNQSRYY